MDYVTTASTGNATDYGDLIAARYGQGGACSSVRGLHMGGYTTTEVNTIGYITIASTGNEQDFGDLTVVVYKTSGICNNIRAIKQGGQNPSSNPLDVMDFVTIATTGNATDFGDLPAANKYMGSSSDGHGGLQSS